ncbi:MAG: L-rhamnose mutarotase [Planctomycetes bacterium]|nr:L-rhamnose mutarotase [Planctomycetota bacterium]
MLSTSLLLLLIAATGLLCSAAGSGGARARPQRVALVIGLRPEKIARYRELHADPWPGVLARISACHIRNYSIHLAELEPGRHYLFAYFEYCGADLEADMAAMAADEETVRWWRETDPCQQPVATAGPAEKWKPMEELFFHP